MVRVLFKEFTRGIHDMRAALGVEQSARSAAARPKAEPKSHAPVTEAPPVHKRLTGKQAPPEHLAVPAAAPSAPVVPSAPTAAKRRRYSTKQPPRAAP